MECSPTSSLEAPPRPLPPLRRSLVLVGLMGAGKSSVGRRLAARLGMPFRDTDHEIEAAAGCSIEEIFRRHGEPEFRAGERRVVARLLEEPPMVLATGGGAFMAPDTRALIRERAISLWLRADVEVLLRRCMRRANRPLLKQGDPKAVLQTLIGERHPVYAEADLVVETGESPQEAVVEKIVELLRARGQVAAGEAVARPDGQETS